MKNDVIRQEIRKRTTMDACAKELGITTPSLYNKVNGDTEWKITELLTMSRLFAWTVDEFLNIIDMKGE